MTNPETAACRTTQHCAFHGWCRRCDPAFAAVMSRVNVAIQRTDADDTHWGPLYAAVAEALRPAAVSVPPPATRADVLRWAAEMVGALDRRELGIQADTIRDAWEEGRDEAADLLRRMADEVEQPEGPCVAGEQQNETPEAAPESCAHCGKNIRLITGTLAAWWVHDPDGNTICAPGQAASSPRATPKPAAEVQDGAAS